MRSYVIRRLRALLPTLILASIIVFVTVRLIPGDVIDLMLSQNDVAADKKSRDDIIAALGMDKPMWQQYFHWISAIVLHGDLGNSLWQGTPVTEHLRARLPVTFQLGFIALIVGLIIALPIGIYSAVRQDTAGDYLARSFSGAGRRRSTTSPSSPTRRPTCRRCCCRASCWARRCQPSPCA